jgi:hypothetical protein
MARKARRYFPNRRNVSRPVQDASERQAQIDVAARRLVDQHSPAELQTMLLDCTTLLEQADQAGTLDPGPVSLARFRRARSDWEVTRRAVELAGSQNRLEP